MEKLHRPDVKEWITKERISVKEFIKDYTELGVMGQEIGFNEDELRLKMISEFGKDQLDGLAAVCDPNLLNDSREKVNRFLYHYKDVQVPEYEGLHNLNAQREHWKQMLTRSYKMQSLKNQKYPSSYVEKIASEKDDQKSKSVCESDEMNLNLINNEEVNAILVVQIYQCLSREAETDFKQRLEMREFEVLSCQPLSVLKDKYKCSVDIFSTPDCSERPDLVDCLNTANQYTSGFLFIEDIFYVDSRNEINIDYSETIRNWAGEGSFRQIGPLGVEQMQNVKFEDLSIRLGYPYLYMHQGECEHLVVFKDIRLFNPVHDEKRLDQYPLLRAAIPQYTVNCNMCTLNSAKWIIFENIRLPHSPFLFCESCFYAFNYDDQKQKIGQFKAYPFVVKGFMF